jgi:hypothetical protein
MQFSLKVKGSVADALTRARRAVEEAGGTLTGDESGGQFSGKSPIGSIAGRYSVVDGEVKVTITQKPFLVPESSLMAKVREYFA